jgi:hypothetical protein
MSLPRRALIKRFLLLALFSAFSLASCSQDDQTIKDPDLDNYVSDSRLMSKMCSKFAEEREAKKLHEVVVAVQLAQPISCVDYYGECNAYNAFLAQAVRVSEDGVLSDDERRELRSRARELDEIVKEGKRKMMSRLGR